MLTVLWEWERVWPYDKDHWLWHRTVICKCDCWNKKQIRIATLTKKHKPVTSCWCLLKWYYNNQNRKHWFYNWDRKFYTKYSSIRWRCINKHNANYKNYWWRWIKFEWNSFVKFKDDMYNSYLEHVKKHWSRDTQIDRIDNDWNYSKDNCRRVTHKKNQNNRRNNVFLTYKWKTQTISQRAEDISIDVKTLDSRRKSWWSDEKVISTPLLHK